MTSPERATQISTTVPKSSRDALIVEAEVVQFWFSRRRCLGSLPGRFRTDATDATDATDGSRRGGGTFLRAHRARWRARSCGHLGRVGRGSRALTACLSRVRPPIWTFHNRVDGPPRCRGVLGPCLRAARCLAGFGNRLGKKKSANCNNGESRHDHGAHSQRESAR